MINRRLAVVALPAFLLVVGCGSTEKKVVGAEAARAAVKPRRTTIEHETCDVANSSAAGVDVNGDGKADVTTVPTGAGSTCRATDLNHDGNIDLFEYLGQDGALRRREASYTASGAISSIELFEGGQRVARELDTLGLKRIDTWESFDAATGKLARRERDSNGDGFVDQWWQFEGDRVTIAIDRNGDGLADPEATVVLGDNASAAPPVGAPGAAPPPPPPEPAAAPPAPPAEAAPATTPPPAEQPTKDAPSGEPSKGASKPAAAPKKQGAKK